MLSIGVEGAARGCFGSGPYESCRDKSTHDGGMERAFRPPGHRKVQPAVCNLVEGFTDRARGRQASRRDVEYGPVYSVRLGERRAAGAGHESHDVRGTRPPAA